MENREKVLHEKFVFLGQERHKLTRELLLLLPEIDSLRVWEKEGFQSLTHYAKVLGGLSEAVVIKTMRIVKKIGDKPNLKAAIAVEGIHKVALLATVATSENEKMLADFVQGANKDAVLEYARELREKQRMGRIFGMGGAGGGISQLADGDGLARGELVSDGASGQLWRKCRAVQKINIELDPEMQYLFLKLKGKYGDKLSNKEVLRRVLREMVGVKFAKDARQSKPENVQDFPGKNHRETAAISAEAHDEANKREIVVYKAKAQEQRDHRDCAMPSRYIKKSLRNLALAKTGHRCGYENCNRPYKVLHHIYRWASSKNHVQVDDRQGAATREAVGAKAEAGLKLNIIPLCKEHHAIMHNGLVDEQSGVIRDAALLKSEDRQYMGIRREVLNKWR